MSILHHWHSITSKEYQLLSLAAPLLVSQRRESLSLSVKGTMDIMFLLRTSLVVY